jgi:hypothetical protein
MPGSDYKRSGLPWIDLVKIVTMTNRLMMTPLVEALIASAGPDKICLVSPDARDAALLSQQAGYPVAYFDEAPSDLSRMNVLFVPIAMDGVFELLDRVDRSCVEVIAIVDDLAEEFLAARFAGLRAVLRNV